MGTEVPHTHIHVIPLTFNHTLSHRQTTTYPHADQFAEYAQKIRS